MIHWWSRVLDFISPRFCVVCDHRLAVTEHSLCTNCLIHLPRTGFQHSPYDNAMAQLFWHVTPVERAAALFFFEPHSELANVVYRMKYNDHPDIGEDLGRVMANDMLQADFFADIDVLLPVPLSRKRMRQRGYNQSECLARGVHDVTHLPVVTKALRRRHFRRSQTMLGRMERQENVRDMFFVKDDSMLRHKHVLLMDDVCTTGATLMACIDVLRHIEGIRLSVLTLGFTKG